MPNDLVLLTNTLAQAESLLNCLDQAAGRIGLYVNVNKTEFMSFKREGSISAFSGKPLKLVDKFSYLGNNVSFTENNINICLSKSVDYDQQVVDHMDIWSLW